jgi:hypothetical protein
MVRAAMVNSARMCSRIAQPTILRAKKILPWLGDRLGEPDLIGPPGGGVQYGCREGLKLDKCGCAQFPVLLSLRPMSPPREARYIYSFDFSFH